MDNNTLSIYIHELRNQCMHVKASFDLFNQANQNRAQPGILYGGQLVLMPASQIASLLWPSRARSRARGEALRKVLQLPEKHSLNDRRLTELWEHMDQKTEEFINSTKGKNVIIDFVGDPQQIDPEADIRDEYIYRAYNPATRVFYYRGIGYNFQAIANAISELSGRINAVWAQMFPEQAKQEAEYYAAVQEAMRKQQEEAAANAEAAGEPTPVETPEAAPTAEAKPAAKKKAPAKKAAAKKPAAKKAPAKKAAEKKPAAKKAPAKKKAAPKKSKD